MDSSAVSGSADAPGVTEPGSGGSTPDTSSGHDTSAEPPSEEPGTSGPSAGTGSGVPSESGGSSAGGASSEPGNSSTPSGGEPPSGTSAGSITVEPTEDPGPSDWPTDVIRLVLDEDGMASHDGTFAGAAPLSSVEWARLPGMGCWSNPLTDEFFSSNHVGLVLDAPVDPWHEVTITVSPTTTNGEATFYVIQQEANRFFTPPEIEQAGYCHVPVTFGGPNTPSTVTFRTYAGQERNIFIGVSSRGRFQREGDFRVEVEVAALAGEERCYDALPSPAGWGDHVNRITLGEDGSWAGTGRLERGAPPCSIDFINASFCAPSTQFENFEGNHVFYALDAPIPAQSLLTVTVTPDPGVDISLYGARQGTTFFEIPPGFNTGGCEASLQHPGRNPGAPESITFVATTNPYNIFFGVAGDAEQGAIGGYTVSVQLISTSTDNCTAEDFEAVRGLADWPDEVNRIEVDPTTGVGVARGDLRDGVLPCTLDWAARSDVACFPLTQRTYFDGRHQFFAIDPPPPAGANVFVTVYPDPDVDVSLYAWRTGVDDFSLPPLVQGVINCEASYPLAVFDRPTNPGVPERVQFLNPTSNPYGYFIGVAGYEGEILHGGYTVEVEIELPPPPHCPESLPGATYGTWPGFVEQVPMPRNGGTVSGTGELADGSCVNLSSWAARSDVACFPATRFDRYEGNHVFYALDRPLQPRSEVIITITPDPGVEVNAYGLLMGHTEHLVPPAVTSAICRASYGLSGPNPGEPEVLRFQNPSSTATYNLLFAVAGDGTTGTTGGFSWTVEERVAVTHCPESLDADPIDDTLPESVQRITLDTDGTYRGSANLSAGTCMNLDFAARSDVACFPAVRNDRFEGNHVFFELTDPIPPNSIVEIELSPRNNADVNLYGFLLGDASWPLLPPFVQNALCNASYGFGQPNPGEPARIQFQNPTGNTYRVLFAAAGPTGVTEAEFDIAITLITAETQCPESLPGESFNAWPASVQQVSLPQDVGEVVTLSGNVNDGACVNLDFAARSDVACFPATQNGFYDGLHVFFALDEPLPPRTNLAIRMIPTGDADLSLYGMQMGASEYIVPPFVTPVICEASNPSLFEGPNPGETERIRFSNPTWSSSYNILFGVASGTAASAGTGAFTLEIERLP